MPKEWVVFTVQAVLKHLLDMFSMSDACLESFQHYSLDVRLCGGFHGLFDLVTKYSWLKVNVCDKLKNIVGP